MLEKIGLPAKPSLRGSSWVLDASHCQACSSQFTLFNRKHHCRRCGGLFCNNCTSQRMYLRGQGDAPVRICDPCKKLEDAARFEARAGQKTRALKGPSRVDVKIESEIHEALTGSARNVQASSSSNSTAEILNLQHSCSASNLKPGRDDATNDSIHSLDESDTVTTEELRQQAQEEKRKYHILKKEKKSNEAMQAFKRGKELERRAEALELLLRKNRRKDNNSSKSMSKRNSEYLEVTETTILPTPGDKTEGSFSQKQRKLAKKDEPEKDDLTSALKELGWSDADLHDSEKRQSHISPEKELSSLLGLSNKAAIESHKGTEQAQVLVHKKRALALKREGNMAEAKDELKKAKLLEKKIEEQMILGQDEENEESDDELATLMRSLDKESYVKPHTLQNLDTVLADTSAVFDTSNYMEEDIEYDNNNMGFEVTDEDMDDPELAAALKSMGWAEEDSHNELAAKRLIDNDRTFNLQNVLSLKREALNLKRSGNVSEAKKKLQQAKTLEMELENLKSSSSVDMPTNSKFPVIKKPGSQKHEEDILIGISSIAVDESDYGLVEGTDEEDMNDPELARALKDLGWQEDKPSKGANPTLRNEVIRQAHTVKVPVTKPRSKSEIQKELLGIKRRALALKREGRNDEAEAELTKGKALEKELENIEAVKSDKNTRSTLQSPLKELPLMNDMDDSESVDVTDADMEDPNLMKILNELSSHEENHPLQSKNPISTVLSGNPCSRSARSKAQIQKELLGIKRKALALRREGHLEEANAELEKGKALEEQLEELEGLQTAQSTNFESQKSSTNDVTSKTSAGLVVNSHDKPVIVGSSSMSKVQSQNEPLDSKAENSALILKEPTQKLGKELVKQVLKKKLEINPASQHPTRATISSANKKSPSEETLHIPVQVAKSSESDNLSSQGGDPFEGMGSLIDFVTLKNDNSKKSNVVESADMMSYGDLVFSTSERKSEDSPNHFDLLSGDSWELGTREPLANVKDPCNLKPENGMLINNNGVFDKGNIYEIQRDKIHIDNSNVEQCPQQVTSPDNRELSDDSSKTRETETTKSDQPAKTASLFSSSFPQDLQQEILSLKRKALALKREGRLAEAKEQLRLAKSLENKDTQHSNPSESHELSTSVSTNSENSTTGQIADRLKEGGVCQKKALEESIAFEAASSSENMAASSSTKAGNVNIETSQIRRQAPSKDRMKLQREALTLKRHALALRREGKLEESEAELEKAKSLESQLEEMSSSDLHAPDKLNSNFGDVGGDLLDPQLMSALKDIFGQSQSKGSGPVTAEFNTGTKHSHINVVSHDSTVSEENEENLREKSALQERIKAEKVKALEFKRAGKQAEALDTLRKAKVLEKKLLSLGI